MSRDGHLTDEAVANDGCSTNWHTTDLPIAGTGRALNVSRCRDLQLLVLRCPHTGPRRVRG
eukprot:4236556-Prymnesium_polylepis.1